MTTYQLVTLPAIRLDADGDCTDRGPVGEILHTFEAPYPGAVRAMQNDLVRVIQTGSDRRVDGFRNDVPAVMCWNLTDGSHVAVIIAEVE